MKQGNKYLFGNGRGNYAPNSLLERAYIKECQKRIDNNYRECKVYNPTAIKTNERTLKMYQSAINAHKHGMKSVNKLRKNLNSKLRHLGKKYIQNELNSYYE